MQVERLNYDNKEAAITIDIMKEQQQDAKAELDELQNTISELKSTQKDASAEDKEKRKQEKMAMMMAKFDTVNFATALFTLCMLILVIIQQGAFSEKDEQLRQILTKLDLVDSDAAVSNLTAEDITAVRRQLGESQNFLRETVDRLRLSQEENEMIMRRRDELEERVGALEAEYEELLEKTIHDEETSNVDIAESMAELKVGNRHFQLLAIV